MATAKLKLYPYVRVSPDGRFEWVSACTWATEEKVEENGQFIFNLPVIELEVEVAEDFRPACVQLLRAHRGEKRAAHQMLMTRMQFQENQLLALAAPEVLDAGDGPKAKNVDALDGFDGEWGGDDNLF